MNTAYLIELRDRLQYALTAEEVFGADIDAGFRRLAAECHPDRFVHDAEDRVLATEVFQALGALRDAPPTAAQRLKSPVREYVLHRAAGAGDLSAIWLAAESGTPDRKFIVKVPSTPKCNALVAKEAEILRQLREAATGVRETSGRYFPSVAESFEVADGAGGGPKKKRINVFPLEHRGYIPLTAIRARHGNLLDARHLAWIFRRTLEGLMHVHATGWINAAVLPEHVLVHPKTHGALLLGWIHSEKIGGTVKSVPKRYREWYPAEVRSREAAGPALDIYLAARSVLWLATGDETGTVPDTLPRRFRGILRGCLLPRAGMRPPDVIVLYDELQEALLRDFGKPRYIELRI